MPSRGLPARGHAGGRPRASLRFGGAEPPRPRVLARVGDLRLLRRAGLQAAPGGGRRRLDAGAGARRHLRRRRRAVGHRDVDRLAARGRSRPGCRGMGGLVCFYRALSAGTMGVVAPIAALGRRRADRARRRHGEKPSAWAWVGMLVAVVGVTLASGPELSGDVSARPVVLASLAAVGFGLALFCLDRGARTSTLFTLWGMRLTSVAILARPRPGPAHRRRRHGPRRRRRCWRSAAATSPRTASSRTPRPAAR